MAGLCPRSEIVLRKANLGHRVPRVADVSGGPPGIATHGATPLPHVCATILAEAVKDGASCLQERVAHLLVDRLHLFVGVDVASAAPIVFEIVHAPGGVSSRILLFVTVASLVARAGIGTG